MSSDTDDRSTRTTDDTRAAQSEPDPTIDPAPVTGNRSGAEDKLWAALHSSPHSTTEELAATAGIGRSTAAKILARWTGDGGVTRAEGTAQGARRAAHKWSITEPDAAPVDAPAEISDALTTAEPAAATAESAAANTAHVAIDEKTDDTAPEEQAAADAAPELSQPSVNDTASSNGSERRSRRLAPGGLRGLVEDHLREHPTDELGPSKIAKELGRSSGAVANALENLVVDGYAVRTKDAPKRYALASTEQTSPMGSSTTTCGGAVSGAPGPTHTRSGTGSSCPTGACARCAGQHPARGATTTATGSGTFATPRAEATS